MKTDIHPEYHEIDITCSCGNRFKTNSTLKEESLHIDVCSNCHPFYTGKQRLVDTAGMVERYRRRYSLSRPAEPEAEEAPQVQADS